MRAVGGNRASRIRFTDFNVHNDLIKPIRLQCSCSSNQRPWLPESTNAPADTSAASAYAQQLEHARQTAVLGVNRKQEVVGTERRSRYLTFDEYVELQKQQQQVASVTANGSGSEPPTQQPVAPAAQNGSKKRVPWNKGRKHSALTIARIIEGNNRARQRPEVKANYEAWNQTRIGVPLPEQHKVRIRERTAEGKLKKLQNTTPEELAARRAAISERSKTLWQDPEYIKKTTAGIKAAQERMRAKRQSSAVEGSSTVKPRQRRTRIADAAGAEERAQQRPVRQPKPKAPTKRELVAAAEQHQQQLQQQVDRMLQTQQLICNTERTVQQLQANLAAFENNPQAYAMASQTMQKAKAHLEQARAQVQQLAQSLDDAGVQWDSSSGQITHIAHGPAAQLLQQKAAGSSKRAKPRTRAVRDTSNRRADAGDDSIDDGIVRSKRGRAPAGSLPKPNSSNGQTLPSLPGDVVPSRRRGQLPDSASQGAGQGLRSPEAAAADAAASGGSSKNSSGSGSDDSWSLVGSNLNGSRSNGAVNGHTAHTLNGNSNGFDVGSDGSRFVTVQLQEAEESDDV